MSKEELRKMLEHEKNRFHNIYGGETVLHAEKDPNPKLKSVITPTFGMYTPKVGVYVPLEDDIPESNTRLVYTTNKDWRA